MNTSSESIAYKVTPSSSEIIYNYKNKEGKFVPSDNNEVRRFNYMILTPYSNAAKKSVLQLTMDLDMAISHLSKQPTKDLIAHNYLPIPNDRHDLFQVQRLHPTTPSNEFDPNIDNLSELVYKDKRSIPTFFIERSLTFGQIPQSPMTICSIYNGSLAPVFHSNINRDVIIDEQGKPVTQAIIITTFAKRNEETIIEKMKNKPLEIVEALSSFINLKLIPDITLISN